MKSKPMEKMLFWINIFYEEKAMMLYFKCEKIL